MPGDIEIPTWTELKAIIDSSDDYTYDYAMQDDVNELIVIVHQSHSIQFFTRIRYSDTTNYTDFMTFYAPYAKRHLEDGLVVKFDTSAGGDLVETEGTLGKLQVATNNIDGLLTRILKELMKMNIHLNEMTDLNLRDSDVEGEY